MQNQLELPNGLFVLTHSLERASDLVVRVEHEEVVELNLAAILRQETPHNKRFTGQVWTKGRVGGGGEADGPEERVGTPPRHPRPFYSCRMALARGRLSR
jgi:hypothetical protein